MEAASAHTHGAHGRLLANCHSSCRPAHLDPVGEQASAGHAAEGHEDGMVCLQPGYPAQQQPGGNGEEGSEGRNARYRPGWHVVGAERVRVAPDLMVGGCRRDGGAVRCGVAGSRLGPRRQYCSAARADHRHATPAAWPRAAGPTLIGCTRLTLIHHVSVWLPVFRPRQKGYQHCQAGILGPVALGNGCHAGLLAVVDRAVVEIHGHRNRGRGRCGCRRAVAGAGQASSVPSVGRVRPGKRSEGGLGLQTARGRGGRRRRWLGRVTAALPGRTEKRALIPLTR